MKDDIVFILPLGRQMARVGFTYAEKRELVKIRARERAERAQLESAGYRKHETDWEIHRGGRQGEVILDARISHDGLYVWTKIGPRPDEPTEPYTVRDFL